MNQPTRGIDVGAIEFIRKKIVDMRSRKKAILLVSADLSEILSLSDTILVMHEGRIVGHISDVKNTSENELGLYMLGVKRRFPRSRSEVLTVNKKVYDRKTSLRVCH